MLPSVQQLESLATDEDVHTCTDGVRIGFLHKVGPHKAVLNKSCFSNTSLFELLQGFFLFYSKFDFNTFCLDAVTGRTYVKDRSKKNSFMTIINPLGNN